MVDALRSLPQSIRTAAFEDNSIAEVRVTLSSYDLIALDAGLPTPADAADQTEAESRFIEMAKEQPVDRGGNGGVVFIPIGFPEGSSYGSFAEVEAELGFNLLSIRSVADLVARPYEFSVLRGDLPISGDLAENVPGVFSTGEWPDGDFNMGEVTAARPFGQTLHLGHRDIDRSGPALGVTLHREFLEDWVAGNGETLLDVPGYAELASILDQAHVTTALITEADYSIDLLDVQRGGLPDTVIDEVRISEPFDLVGIGSSTKEGRTTATVVYNFADAAVAERALVSVEEAWRNGMSIVNTGSRISDRFDIKTVDHVGRSVVVTLGILDDRTARSVNFAFDQRDSVFLHR